MGSFNATCIVSNLPIEAGTPVRYLNLTGSKYHRDGNDHVCYVGGRWHLRGPAVRAKYNDYGSVEGMEESLATRVMFESLARDAVEKGVGDNQYHDVQVRPNMSQDEWLNALWEGQVFVQDDGFRRRASDGKWVGPEPKEGIPSFLRLEQLAKDFGHAPVTGYGADGLVIDEVSSGFFRVRDGRDSFGEKDARLESFAEFVRKAGYAAMVTCGTGMYSNHAEVLVAPLPAKKGDHIHASGLAKDEFRANQTTPRPVAQAMVREDVWQILLATKFEWYSGDYDLEAMKVDARKALDDISKVRKKSDGERELAMYRYETSNTDNHFWSSIRHSEGVSGFSLSQSVWLGVELAKDDTELEAYLMTVCETAYAQLIYSQLHGQWHPTTNSGQDGNWDKHRAFLTELLKIKGRWENENDEG